MPDLSADLRDYFDAVVESIDHELEIDLVVPLAEVERPRHRRRVLVAACAALLGLAAAGIGVLALGGDGGSDVDVVDQPTESPEDTDTSLEPAPLGAGLAPGWHDIDSGPLPAVERPTMAWSGAELFVGVGPTMVFSLDASTGEWTQLPRLPDGMGSGSRPPALVSTDVGVLAVEDTFGGAGSALWDGDRGRWVDLGEVDVAENLRTVRTGMRARGSWGGGPALVWTGEAVLDLYHGAVWSPNDHTWGPLAGPAEVTRFAGLTYTNPVWDGHEVVAVSWSTAAGLAWNATGTEYRELPGLPEGLAEPDHGNDALATVVGGRVLLVSGSSGVPTAWFDSRTGMWTAESPVRLGPTGEGCPSQVATTDDGPVVEPCEPGVIFVLANGEWQRLDGAPGTGATTWLEVDGNLLVWGLVTSDEGVVTPRAAVWVPPREGTGLAGNAGSG